jgi:hypothetical protein
VSRPAARTAGVAALALWLVACGPPGGSPPLDRAPGDAMVAAALQERVNAPDLPEMAVRPNPGEQSVPSCQRAYRVESVSVRQRVVRDDTGVSIVVSADFTASRLLPPDAPSPKLYSCFGAETETADWQGAAPLHVKGEAEITWQDGIWLLRVGDEYIPLAPTPAR